MRVAKIVITLVVASRLHAATFIVPDDRALVRASKAVVIATAGESRSQWTSSGWIETVTTMRVDEAIRGCDTVFHLAASVGNTRSIEHPIDDSEINVIGTLRILEAARRAKSRKVVFSSSAGIFGELKTLPIREDHPVEPDSPYGASKLGAEKLCLAYAKLYPLSCVCLRWALSYSL